MRINVMLLSVGVDQKRPLLYDCWINAFCNLDWQPWYSYLSSLLHDGRKEQSEYIIVSKCAQTGLLSVLLLLTLLCMVIATINAAQSIHDFQLQYNNARAENVNALRPWMTIPIVSHVYHVPEDNLCKALNIAKTDPLQRATLYEIAAHRQRPVEQVVHTLQYTIQTYRTKHPLPHQRLYLSTQGQTRWPPTLSAMSTQEETNG